MIYLIIINSIINLFLLYKYFKTNPLFYISVDKTFWCNFIYGFYLMKYTSNNSAESILYIQVPFRSREKLNKLDKELFESGEYKKYNK